MCRFLAAGQNTVNSSRKRRRTVCALQDVEERSCQSPCVMIEGRFFVVIPTGFFEVSKQLTISLLFNRFTRSLSISHPSQLPARCSIISASPDNARLKVAIVVILWVSAIVSGFLDNIVRGERAKRASRSNTRRGNHSAYSNRTFCYRHDAIYVLKRSVPLSLL